MDLMNELIANALGLRFEDLSESDIAAVKRSVLDTLAVIIAGSSADGIEQLTELIKAWGGRRESSILVYGGKVPAITAALVNSTMARARDLDDVHEPGAIHLSATIIPAAFVTCEYGRLIKDKLTNGRDFITAVALGSDFLCRLRIAGPGAAKEGGWSSETPAPLAVAMMGSKLLEFDKLKLSNSLGIAYAQCSGNIQAITDGALTVRLQQGFGAMSGILSILLADKGLTGAKDILNGKYGYYPLYMHGQFNPEVLMKDLGKRFESSNVSIKSYPCCKFTHTAIFGALKLVEEKKVQTDQIKKVTIHTKPHGHTLCGEERKRIPNTVADAQFSYYYTVATALVREKVFLEDFTEAAIRDNKVLSMARRIEIISDPTKDLLEKDICPVDIEIETYNGNRYTESVEHVKGSPEDPMSFDDLKEKLRNCAAFSVKGFTKKKLERIGELVEHLEELDDVTELIKCLR